MRRLLAVAVCSLPAWPLAAAGQERAWKEYVYADDHFAISAPAEPKRETQRIRVVGGSSTAHIYSVTADDKGAFMVFVYLRNRADRRTERQVREDAGTGAVQSVKGKLTAKSEVLLGRYRGSLIELESQIPEIARKSHRVRNQYYVVGRRLYQIMAIAPAGEPFPAESDRWFKSFRLIRGSRRH
jgi:hypothetical protein